MEYVRKPILRYDGKFQVGPGVAQQRYGRRRKDAVAQGPQSYYCHAAARFKGPENVVLEGYGQTLVRNNGFVDQHYRNIIANRIYAAAADALQAGGICCEFHLRLAGGAHEDFEEVRAESHLPPF